MQAYKGNRDLAPFSASAIHEYGWSSSRAGRFTPKKKQIYQQKRKQGELQIQPRYFGDDKNFLLCPGW